MKMAAVHEVTVKDVRFDNPVLNALHTHPLIYTVAIVFVGGAVVGLLASGIRYAKCGGIA